MVVSALLLLADGSDDNSAAPAATAAQHQQLWFRRLYRLLLSGRKMFVLVVLYNVANTCSLYATGTVGASVSTLFTQLKILTTAICSTLILGRRYSTRKWICLLVLMVGVTCVSFPLINEVVDHHRDADEANTAPEDHRALQQKVLGLLCLVIQISISGFASVYLELVLKDRQEVATIWERNFQLAFYSVLFTLMVVFLRNGWQALTLPLNWDPPSDSSAPPSLLPGLPGEGGQRMNIFAGWTRLAVVTALCQGCAGILIAATLKYADAVLKCFASSLAIIVVTVVNMRLLGQAREGIVILGIVMSLAAMLTYSLDSGKLKSS